MRVPSRDCGGDDMQNDVGATRVFLACRLQLRAQEFLDKGPVVW
jgi:hypothetical protein